MDEFKNKKKIPKKVQSSYWYDFIYTEGPALKHIISIFPVQLNTSDCVYTTTTI